MNTLGAACTVLYYVMVTAIGVWAARKYHTEPFHIERKRKEKAGLDYVVRLLLVNREMTLALGTASLVATWMGAGLLSHLATEMFARGLLSCYAPLSYAMAFALGGSFFAHKLHETGSTTVLDPLQRRFGQRLVIVYFIPCLCGEVLWSAVSLSTLGSTMNLIIEVNEIVCIIISSIVTLFYTSLGGLYSIIYTDLFQVVILLSGLLLSLPFCLHNAATSATNHYGSSWIGTVTSEDFYHRIDRFITVGLGGISVQDYVQRVLACPEAQVAEAMSYSAAFGCMILAVPAIIIGGCAKTANFTTTQSNATLTMEDIIRGNVLAMAIRTLTPGPVAVILVLGFASSVMATVDSTIFSAATMLSHNIYKGILRPKASTTELVLVLRLSVLLLGAFATYIAVATTAVNSMWNYASDLLFILLFPQMVCILFLPDGVNAYGSLTGFFLGLLLRTAAGEPGMGLPTLFRYPGYDSQHGRQLFPYRTFSMVAHLLCMLVASRVVKKLFVGGIMPMRYDFLQCFHSQERRPSTASLKPVSNESEEKRKNKRTVAAERTDRSGTEGTTFEADQEQSLKSGLSLKSGISLKSGKSGQSAPQSGISGRSVVDVPLDTETIQQKGQAMAEGTEICVRLDRTEKDTMASTTVRAKDGVFMEASKVSQPLQMSTVETNVPPKGQTAAPDAKTTAKKKAAKKDRSKEDKEKKDKKKEEKKEEKEEKKENDKERKDKSKKPKEDKQMA
ncbi:high-affinity choline transporter 1-like isoform X2 [Ornithodoros turicata]|uniref:high-affinity choline transporter 1-like isoform X2 n=1 Tax=Ornithodoros turicata TaxID=34597 RepID=UPI00313A1447